MPFDTETLDTLYPTHGEYVRATSNAIRRNLRDGFLLEEDVEELRADAASSIYGRGLTCGPLCANVAQFPLNPSTSILRDHTRFYYFEGGDALVHTLDRATLQVARGYTWAGQPDPRSQERGRRSFAAAIETLEVYTEQVEHLEARGRAAPEPAALLIDFADTLIGELEVLAGSSS